MIYIYICIFICIWIIMIMDHPLVTFVLWPNPSVLSQRCNHAGVSGIPFIFIFFYKFFVISLRVLWRHSGPAGSSFKGYITRSIMLWTLRKNIQLFTFFYTQIMIGQVIYIYIYIYIYTYILWKLDPFKIWRTFY